MDTQNTQNYFSYDDIEALEHEEDKEFEKASQEQEKILKSDNAAARLEKWKKNVYNSTQYLTRLGVESLDSEGDIDDLLLRLAFEHRMLSKYLQEAIFRRITNRDTNTYFRTRIDYYKSLFDTHNESDVVVLYKKEYNKLKSLEEHDIAITHKYEKANSELKKLTKRVDQDRVQIKEQSKAMKELKEKYHQFAKMRNIIMNSLKRSDGLLLDFKIWSPKGTKHAMEFFDRLDRYIPGCIIEQYKDDEQYKEFVEAAQKYNEEWFNKKEEDDDDDDDEYDDDDMEEKENIDDDEQTTQPTD